MRVLVTGGAGYIGSVTAALLLERGYAVTVLDDLRSGHRDLIPDDAHFVEANVGEPVAYADALAGHDACLHFAASAEAGLSMQRPEAFYANNTAATLRLLQALVNAGIERFVLSSTCAVYGQPERVPISEDEPKEPANAYGHSKLLIEQALPWLGELRGLRYAALRYFNAAGATERRGEDHAVETHLIPLVLQVAEGRRAEIDVYGTDYPTRDGTCVRDYIHVADLAEAHVLALERLDEHERIVCNLGTGSGFTVCEVIEAARQLTGHAIPAHEAPRCAGDPATLVAAAGRAHALLGWTPRRSDLEELVGSAWRWQQQRSARRV
ncbi:MAG: UDP-glucose 4-epimerase GalE [Egibacteraceae bacterium]